MSAYASPVSSFPCPVCPKLYESQNGLRRHIGLHHGMKQMNHKWIQLTGKECIAYQAALRKCQRSPYHRKKRINSSARRIRTEVNDRIAYGQVPSDNTTDSDVTVCSNSGLSEPESNCPVTSRDRPTRSRLRGQVSNAVVDSANTSLSPQSTSSSAAVTHSSPVDSQSKHASDRKPVVGAMSATDPPGGGVTSSGFSNSIAAFASSDGVLSTRTLVNICMKWPQLTATQLYAALLNESWAENRAAFARDEFARTREAIVVYSSTLIVKNFESRLAGNSSVAADHVTVEAVMRQARSSTI